jgi:hypothetical protein
MIVLMVVIVIMCIVSVFTAVALAVFTVSVVVTSDAPVRSRAGRGLERRLPHVRRCHRISLRVHLCYLQSGGVGYLR